MLNFKTSGSGIPFVLVHAWPLSSGMWERQLKTLSDKVRLITPDVPGLGNSARQKTPSLSEDKDCHVRGAVGPASFLSIAEMAQEVAALLDHLTIQEPVMIGGLSVGGYVTFEFLRQFPQRVRGIGLFATRANADTPQVRERRFKNIEFLETHLLEEFLPRVVPNLLLGPTAMKLNPAAVEKTKSLILKNSPEGIADVLRAMAARQDSTELLGKIKCPTLVMAGDEDGFVTVEESKAMHAKIPGAEFYLMKNTGHLLNLENPEEFDSIVRDFITRHF